VALNGFAVGGALVRDLRWQVPCARRAVEIISKDPDFSFIQVGQGAAPGQTGRRFFALAHRSDLDGANRLEEASGYLGTLRKQLAHSPCDLPGESTVLMGKLFPHGSLLILADSVSRIPYCFG
jgi:hypothetical protein